MIVDYVDQYEAGHRIWVEIKLHDGSTGIILGDTKCKKFIPDDTCRGFKNLIKILRKDKPEESGFDIPACITTHEFDLIKYIQTAKDPERVIMACHGAGADWLLEKDILDEGLIESLIQKSYQFNQESVWALLDVERVQERELVNQELIDHFILHVNEENNWYKCISCLLSIEKSRKDGKLIADILTNYETSYNRQQFSNLTELWQQSRDDRIIDFLITMLDREFRVEVPNEDVSISALFVTKYGMGKAFYAAEALLKIGE